MRAFPMTSSSQHGFTLLEMLIALSLFAMMGIMSHRLLTTSLQIDERMEQQFAQQVAMRQLFLILHDDIEQMIPRETRRNNERIPSFFQDPADNSISFVRGGYGNFFIDDEKRSRLMKVRYLTGKHPDRDKKESRYYRDERQYLLRIISTKLDVAESSAVDESATVQALMPGITEFNLLPLFTSGTGFSERALPLLPKSVVIEMSGQSVGSLTHTIMVR